MKTKIIILLLMAIGLTASAQQTVYKMNVKMTNGSIYTVDADDVEEVYFTSFEAYDPSQPATVDVASIHAPQEGGHYVVNVSCNVQLFTTTGYVDQSYNPWYDYFQTSMDMTYTYNNGVLIIDVNPARYRIISDRTVNLYDGLGNTVISIPVTQDGNPNGTILNERGAANVNYFCSILSSFHSMYRIADAKYTGLIDNEEFKAPIDPDNDNLRELFSKPYDLINQDFYLLQLIEQTGVTVLLPMCQLMNALAYYEMVTMFGGVPYITNPSMYNIGRTPQDELLQQLIDNLTSIINNLQDEKAGYISNPESIALPSKDLVRVVLADIYMYQGNYALAKPLLEEIVESNRYSLISDLNNMSVDNPEIIWSMDTGNPNTRASRRNAVTFVIDYDPPYTIIKTYADVLLSLAECESILGNDSKAMQYLNQVKAAKAITTSSSGVLPIISEIRSKIQVDFGGYFAFLKRTGLALSTLGIEEYQLLFPIPLREMMMNPSLTQNPGY